MTQTIKLKYGLAQPLVSKKMQAHPVLASWINKLFGSTNIGNYARSKVFRKQVNILPLNQVNKVLDLGCGYGEYSFMMANGLPHAKVTALDIDPEALKNVRFAHSKLNLPNLTIFDGYLRE